MASLAFLRTAPALALLGAACALTGCQAFSREDPRPCPQVRIDAATAEMTRFRPGPGRDITDIELTGRVTGYEGTCSYDKTGVTVEMVLSFAIGLGPAASSRDTRFDYFVALPNFYPQPAAKQTYEVATTFPPNVDRVVVRDEKVRVRIPLDAGASAADQDVYVGFQLTGEQLDYNRSRRPGTPS
ncbi:hypothetical protein [Pararhodospirillum oryzae]|uniref:Uncharacterized protein n=1 Tax=Pararhodospirillum oryzae TaxID=478448 RepID=A0A512H3G2_9PROT|nr:hypothetical protein [Pararhodospirillum oryzae]GEO79994.1 hypothetical protein ROR02_01250 [Pararhodospirillum oryzae]